MSRFERLSAALRLLRQRRGESGRKLAEKLGIAPSVVSRWENGREISLEALGKVADHYGLHLGDLDDLLADAGSRVRLPRRLAPPQNEEEIAAFLDALLGPAGTEDEVGAVLREALEPALRRAARRRARLPPGAGA